MNYVTVGGNDEQGYPVAPHIKSFPLHGIVTSQGLGGGNYRSPRRMRRRSPGHRSRHRISARRAQDLIRRHIAGANLRRMSPKYLRREIRRLDKEFPRRRRY